MQFEYCDIDVIEGFSTRPGFGAAYQKRFRLIAGLSAIGFLFLGGAEISIFLGGADIFAFLFGHNHPVVDLPFQLQTIVIAGLSFGLCVLAMSLLTAV
jgi:hypothetical protein